MSRDLVGLYSRGIEVKALVYFSFLLYCLCLCGYSCSLDNYPIMSLYIHKLTIAHHFSLAFDSMNMLLSDEAGCGK